MIFVFFEGAVCCIIKHHLLLRQRKLQDNYACEDGLKN